MIKRKQKLCIGCNTTQYIFGKKLCNFCYAKQGNKKPIKKVSDKRKKEDVIYFKLAKQHKIDNPICQAKLNHCTHYTTETHHKKGRTGKNYLDVSTFLSLCHNCHQFINENPDYSLEMGFTESRLQISDNPELNQPRPQLKLL